MAASTSDGVTGENTSWSRGEGVTVVSRHRRRRSHDLPVIAWLRAGSAVAALGAAVATGHGVASADTGTDGSASSVSRADTSSASPDSGDAKTTSIGVEQSPTSGTESVPASGTGATGTAAHSSHPTSTVSVTTISGREESPSSTDDSASAGSSSTTSQETETAAVATPITPMPDVPDSPTDTSPKTIDAVATTNPPTTKASAPPAATTATTTRTRAVAEAKPATAVATSPSDPPPTTTVAAPATAPLSLVTIETARVTPTALVAKAASSTISAAITATPAAATQAVTLSGIVTDILTWFGLPALSANSPIPALPIPDPFASLWIGLREVEYRLNNRTPTAHPVSNAQDPQTGVITGNLNATDLDGDPLTYTVTTSPTHGGVTVHSDGSYTYTPDADFALSGGTDTVRVQIREANAATHLHGITGLFADIVNALGFGQAKLSDGSTTTAVLQFVVTPIAAVNHAPVAPTTQGAVTYDPITGVATGNLGFTDPDSDPLTYTVTTTPAYGSVTVATNGTYTYTPTDAGRAQAATTPGLTDAFAVTASDGQLTAPTTVTITVTADLPVAHPDSYTIGQDTTLNITSPGILANDVDPDGDSVVYVRNITDPKHGTLGVQTGDTNPPGGGFTYTPNPGFWGTDTFTYAASDQAGHIGAPTTVTITVTADLPVAHPDSYTIGQDTTLNITSPGILANDVDPDGDSVVYVRNITDPKHGTLGVQTGDTNPPGGGFTYTPNPGFWGTDTFTYAASDQAGHIGAPTTVTITVTPALVGPVSIGVGINPE